MSAPRTPCPPAAGFLRRSSQGDPAGRAVRRGVGTATVFGGAAVTPPDAGTTDWAIRALVRDLARALPK